MKLMLKFVDRSISDTKQPKKQINIEKELAIWNKRKNEIKLK